MTNFKDGRGNILYIDIKRVIRNITNLMLIVNNLDEMNKFFENITY